ncbi:MAG: 3-phosphoshikimate 1-carboxyvinyltransferase [Clostridia bacterium]|nr:3-phosphoshikimate 1-carboxyvinyltransferase [Clostridia bacterium]
MDIKLSNPKLKRNITLPSSKSEAHRYLLCAALTKNGARVPCHSPSKDIEATAGVLSALGAKSEYKDGCFEVSPINADNNITADCGESGTTLRFMLALCAALGVNAEFICRGRLAKRPLFPFDEMMRTAGVTVTQNENTVKIEGKMPENASWSIDGSVSSQFISGMLFALTLCGGTLTVTGKTESKPYIDLTVDIIRKFGGDIEENGNTYIVRPSTLTAPENVFVGGDWSGAAFPLCIGAVGKHPVSVSHLDTNSTQGDKEIIAVLSRMGARTEICGSTVTAHPSKLHGIKIDCANIPDTVPALAITALSAEGETEFVNAKRLRYKESDRISAVCEMIHALGGKADENEDGFTVYGGKIAGGTVDSKNDHRIAMAASIAAFFTEGDVIIQDAECVNKSYPEFWNEFED